MNVRLSATSIQQVTVKYSTINGTAIAGGDYTSQTGTLTFTPGQTLKTISIPILNNNIPETDEAFKVILSNPTHASISDNQGIVTISDTLKSAVNTTLPAKIENLQLTGTSSINGTGNTNSNRITGNGATNILNGGAGADTLTGGAGADRFVFQFGQSTVASTDRITDFAIGSDKIDLLTGIGGALPAPLGFVALPIMPLLKRGRLWLMLSMPMPMVLWLVVKP